MGVEDGRLMSDDPDVVVRTAHRAWRCSCAEQVWRYSVRGEYAEGGWSETYARTPAEAEAVRSTRQARVGRHDGRLRVLSRVTVTEVANPGYRPDCLGDISPGDRYAEYVGEAGPGDAGTRYCARCAVAVWRAVRLDAPGSLAVDQYAESRPPATGEGTRFVYDDGGRAAAGFRGDAGDCVTRAIAIATGMGYRDVYDAVNSVAKRERFAKSRKKRSSARTGVHKGTLRQVMADLGWTWVPAMRIGQGCTVHLRADELPPGRLVVKVSRHCVAVVDGQVHDTHDPARGGTRCVYGYFTQPGPGNVVTPRPAPPGCQVEEEVPDTQGFDELVAGVSGPGGSGVDPPAAGGGAAAGPEAATVTFLLAGAGYQVAAGGGAGRQPERMGGAVGGPFPPRRQGLPARGEDPGG